MMSGEGEVPATTRAVSVPYKKDARMASNEGAALLAMWDDAAAPTIEVRAPTWPELTEFSRYLSTLFGSLADIEMLASVRRSGFSAYRYLTSTPLSPADVEVELPSIIEDCRNFVKAWPSHSLSQSLISFADAARGLLCSESPFANELELVGSRYDQAILLVPRESLKIPVKLVLDRLELNGVQVATKAELRVATGRAEAVIVIGDPAITYASMWIPASLEAQRSGWLLTAPSASHVIVLLAGGCQTIDSSMWWLLDTEQHPTMHFRGRHGNPITLPTVLHHFEGVHSRDILPAVPPPPGVATSTARLVSFVSGRIVFFSDEAPPEPRILSFAEDGSIDIDQLPVQDLGPDSILLLRVGHSEAEELRHRAIERLRADGWSETKVRQSLEAAEHLKSLLKQLLAIHGRQYVEEKLRAEGLSKGYAQGLVHRPLRFDYIAPAEKGYDAFVNVLGEFSLKAKRGLLVGLRTATRQAGRDIRFEMEKRLGSSLTWRDDLDADGFARIHTERLGTIFLEVVVQVHDGDRQVATSNLGHLLNRTGERFAHQGLTS